MNDLSAVIIGRSRPANEITNCAIDSNIFFIPNLYSSFQSSLENSNNTCFLPSLDYQSGSTTNLCCKKKFLEKESIFGMKKSLNTYGQQSCDLSDRCCNKIDKEIIKKLRIREDMSTQDKIIDVVHLKEQIRPPKTFYKNNKEEFVLSKKNINPIKIPSLSDNSVDAKRKENLSSLLNFHFEDDRAENIKNIIQNRGQVGETQDSYSSSTIETLNLSDEQNYWKHTTFQNSYDDNVPTQREKLNLVPVIKKNNYFGGYVANRSNLEEIKLSSLKTGKSDQACFSDSDRSQKLDQHLFQATKENGVQTPSDFEISDDDSKYIDLVFDRDDMEAKSPDNHVSVLAEILSPQIYEKKGDSLPIKNQNEYSYQEQTKINPRKSKKGRRPVDKKLKSPNSSRSTNFQSEIQVDSESINEFFNIHQEEKEHFLLSLDSEIKNPQNGKTRIGTQFQALVLPFGSNSTLKFKRKPKLRWEPILLEENQKNQYYCELSRIVERKEITNEAVALGTLTKNQMSFDKALEEVKNNLTYFKGHFNPGSRILRDGHFY